MIDPVHERTHGEDDSSCGGLPVVAMVELCVRLANLVAAQVCDDESEQVTDGRHQEEDGCL
jgi:hypothetical protein